MGETAGAVILLLLAAWGCVQAVRALTLCLLRPKESRGIWLIPLRGHREDGEQLVRWGAALCRWGWPAGRMAYVLDLGADPSARDVVCKTCEAVEGVRLIEPEELVRVMSADPSRERFAG